MVASTTLRWSDANQLYLNARLELIRQALKDSIPAHGTGKPHSWQDYSPAQRTVEEIQGILPAPAALDELVSRLGLTDFERDVLLLCVGVELDQDLLRVCAETQADLAQSHPTFGLAMAILPQPHWSALLPISPLRRWHLIQMTTGPTLTSSPIQIDERILHYLLGLSYLDPRLNQIIKPLNLHGELVPSHRAVVERMIKTWRESHAQSNLPILALCGGERSDKQAMAAAICREMDLNLYRLSIHQLSQSTTEIQTLTILLEREALLTRSAFYIDGDRIDSDRSEQWTLVTQLLETLQTPLFISLTERLPLDHRSLQDRSQISFDISSPTMEEQRQLWIQGLGAMISNSDPVVETLIGNFNLSTARIRSICDEVRTYDPPEDSLSSTETFQHRLWEICRQQARQGISDLAQRIDPAATWQELVLPDPQRQILRDIVAQVRQRAKVYGAWGFRQKSSRGMGICALFAGASGTGKTMAAEVLAQELQLDLFRIDLSTVVSKYIGETEKNLARVFSAAETAGAILLFDEADALFGKRSDVKDSHDRYANMEVAYLLQRMEAYRGLSILTTNLKDSIDNAFLRRIRFVIRFAFPTVAQRMEIWQHVFPQQTPVAALRYEQLAQLQVAGGSIRNIALYASFLAAEDGGPVAMEHILRAARHEYGKLERTLTDAEIKGWI